jgi:hypothetical protein
VTGQHLEAFLARIYVDDDARRKFLADRRGEAIRAGLSERDVESVVNIDAVGLELFAESIKRKRHGRRPPRLEGKRLT